MTSKKNLQYKVVSIVGARPQFIKLGLVSQALKAAGRKIREILIHTGQHYDYKMSDLFFEELQLKTPDYHLQCGSGSHGTQTGKMLFGIEQVLYRERPDLVLVFGDTNTTLAGALAAVKLCIPVAHVEAGLRSNNWAMPEEVNRVITDRLSSILFCPTNRSRENLKREGIQKNVHVVGDVMIDMLRHFESIAERRSGILKKLGLSSKAYYLSTLHRPVNADQPVVLGRLLRLFRTLDLPVIFPVHPRTRKQLRTHELGAFKNLRLIDPVGYLDMVLLEKYAKAILTDSGGIQKEAYYFHVPCLTLRDETEWVETVESGWNRVVGTDPRTILSTLRTLPTGTGRNHLFGDGNASQKIALKIRNYLEEKTALSAERRIS